MALRGKQPTAVEKRLKTLFYGIAGVGKTMAAIQFPKPYLIDTEKGAENDEYVKTLAENGGVIFQTSDFDELATEVKSLLTEKHPYKTLIIDPLTVVYNDLLDKSAKSLISKEDPTGTAYSRHKGPADRKLKHLLNLLLRLDMNVIITSHAKGEWKNGQPTGVDTFDCYAKLDYLFDLVIEIQKKGKERFGVVKKTRMKSFEEMEYFPFSYNAIADKYGRKVLEREAVAQALASPQQVARLTHLINVLKVESEVIEKWLDKAQASTIEEMSKDAVEKCITHLDAKLHPEGTKGEIPVPEPDPEPEVVALPKKKVSGA